MFPLQLIVLVKFFAYLEGGLITLHTLLFLMQLSSIVASHSFLSCYYIETILIVSISRSTYLFKYDELGIELLMGNDKVD